MHLKHKRITFVLIGLLLLIAGCNEASKKPDAKQASSPHFEQGQSALLASKNKKAQTREALLEANATRKQLLKVRRAVRSTEEGEQKDALSEHANGLSDKLENLQAQGVSLRQESQADLKRAQQLFEQAMTDTWSSHINSKRPLALAETVRLNFAHNTEFRSVHPSMLNKMGTQPERELPEGAEPATLIPPAAAGQNPPEDLDITSFQLSAKQALFAHIEAYSDGSQDDTEVDPKLNIIPLNSIHQWRLLISDLKGQPLQNAKISVTGHMPGHVHGLPTAPRVTKEMSPGVYLVEGLKFQMQGWWVMQFNIDNNDTTDSSTINNTTNNSATEDDTPLDTITFNLVL